MIHYIHGVLAYKGLHPLKGDAYLVVEVQGIGYWMLTTQRALGNAPAVGENALIHTVEIIRPESRTMVGFLQRDERDLFQLLQGASGVGTKVSLALLNAFTVSELVHAIIAQEHKVLTAAKGVGPKMAQRIVVDLKEKMTQWQDALPVRHTQDFPSTAQSKVEALQGEPFQEAESVLLSLGYTHNEVVRSLEAVCQQPNISSYHSSHQQCPAELLLREALRWLATQPTG